MAHLRPRLFDDSRREIDDTSADPFCGFNLGWTVFRATPDRTKPPRKYIFESPVLRLASDFGYGDVYTDGLDIMDDEWSDRTPPQKVHHYLSILLSGLDFARLS